VTCDEVKDLMAASWHGELDQATIPAFERHLETCAECSAEMAALSGVWEQLISLPEPDPSRALHARWHATLASLVPERKRAFWPRLPVWQAAIALACVVVGVVVGIAVGANLPGRNNEIAKLHEEIASTRAMVALSLLQQQSATERLRGVDYTGQLQTMDPEVVSALIQAVSHDANVNVRLAAIDALSKVATHPGVVDSLTRSLARQDSPMVQAALIDYLVDAHGRQAVGTLRQLASRPDLNPAVLERTHFALQQLTQ
jgi:hypothetical protein